MSKLIVSILILSLLGIASIASAQNLENILTTQTNIGGNNNLLGTTQSHSGPNFQEYTKNNAPLTPEENARILHMGQLEQSACDALVAGNYALAETDARQSLRFGFDAGMTQETLAQALMLEGKTQEAYEAYEQMAQEGTGFPRNLLPFALLSLKLGNYAQAIAAYNKALPHLAEGEIMRAHNHFSSTASDPRELETDIHIALGLTYLSDGWPWGYSANNKALDEFKAARNLEPASDLANLYYAHGLQRVGDSDGAKEAFDHVAQKAQGDVQDAAQKALVGRWIR